MTKFRILAMALIVILTSLSSCKKTPTSIGNNLQPESTYIKVFSATDTSIIAHTERVDSLPTSASTTLMIGSTYDQIFGSTSLETFMQFSPSVLGQEWGDNAVADSVVLQLCYSNYYGDTLAPLTFTVKEIDEEFADTTSYYSHQTLATKAVSLAEWTFSPHPNTYSNIDDDSLTEAVLRIPLDISLGQSFIENQDKFVSNDTFVEFFKGVNIACNMMVGKGSICFFDAVNSYTYMRLYYHNDTDTLTYDLNVTSSNYHFGHYVHDHNTAINPIQFNDSVYNPYLYVQGAAGARSWIKFTDVAQWAKSLNTNILINEARLVLTGATGTIGGAVNDTAVFTPPTQLVALKRLSDGSSETLDDQNVGSVYFSGYYSDDGTVYFRLNRYVQDLILAGPDAENYGLFIIVSGHSNTPRQWVFNGPDLVSDTLDPIRLELIYSKINN